MTDDQGQVGSDANGDRKVDRRVDRVLADSYLEGLDAKTPEELREMLADARKCETEVSYVRRLAQARIDIFCAEQDRRKSGGSVGDLIAALPNILAGDESRPDPTNARLPQEFAPPPEVEFQRGLEKLVGDASLANLPTLSDETVTEKIDALRGFEDEVSGIRKKLHNVIDLLERELT